MNGSRIAVAMSGGLDSSVAALLLARGGEPVVGLSMLLWDRSSVARNGRCCGSLDLADARRVAQEIGIVHYTLRLEREFSEQVVGPFVDDYLEGRTPSPCIRCNSWIKFGVFLDRARALGATRVATGHYARIVEGEAGPELHRAADPTKDQSYFLFELGREELDRVVFPLGDLRKAEVRELARRENLTVAGKAESMELCFVETDIESFVAERVGSGEESASEIVDTRGRSLGHASAPYYRYTVGQRKGLGLGSGRRLYVLEIDPQENRLVVGGDDEAASQGLLGDRVHWIGPRPSGPLEAEIRIRSRHSGVRGRIREIGGGAVEVDFEVPQTAVAPGQAAVFYEGTRVLGGCWIREGRGARLRRTA